MDTEVHDKEFVQCVIRHEPILKAYGRSLLPTWEGVEEVLQETYLIAWRKWDKLQSSDEFLPWAKTILRFEALKYRRNKATDKHILDEDILEMLAEEGEAASQDSLNEKQQVLAQCLQSLKQNHRQLVLSHYQAGESLVNIASRFGKSSNSLYKLMGRLRQKLQDCIETKLSVQT